MKYYICAGQLLLFQNAQECPTLECPCLKHSSPDNDKLPPSLRSGF